ncbi:MAG: pantothenate kinase [Zetaproteobacteria bacterium]|nr:MAG: pantothenate kinase [Zetaproteobacteria bacterium]
MLLAIDVGNTNTVFALFRDDNILYSWRCATEASRSVDEYAVFLNQLFELESIKWSDIADIIISSVVPDTDFHLTELCRKNFKIEPLFVTADLCKIKTDLDQPKEIGADRIASASAVIAHYKLPAVVIDFGTATTFDVIDENGVYLGGVIAPGIRLSVEALTLRAAKLPRIKIEKPDNVIGKNTTQAMQSGMYWGYIGVIDTIIGKIKTELNTDVFVLATGGLAPLYAQSTDNIDVVDGDLILKGLLEIYKKVKANA